MPKLLPLVSLLMAAPLAAEQNPFAFINGPIKSAYIIYDMSNTSNAVSGGIAELGVTDGSWVLRMVTPFDMSGKTDTLHSVMVETRDSVYKWNIMGRARAEGQVSPSVRLLLVTEYEALDAGGKARLRENLKLAAALGGSDDDDLALVSLVGERAGSQTIAGQRCDIYRAREITVCVLPQAPMIPLRWTSSDGSDVVARKVALNGAMPPALAVLPRGVRWKKEPIEGWDFALQIWAMKNEGDTEATSPAAKMRFVVRYLASPQAADELRQRLQGEPDAP